MNRSRLALASLSLTTLMASLDTSIANSGLPAISKALHTSFQGGQWIVLAYLLTVTSFVVPAGRAADFFGRRRLLIIGIATFTVASVACGFAPTIEWLIAARAIQGLGAALMMALTLAMAKEVAAEEKAGSTIGLLGTMSAIGTALGPTLGGLLIATSGWPAIYLVNLPIGILNLTLVFRAFRPDASTMPQEWRSFGLPSVAILATALLAYSVSMTVERGAWGLALFGIAIVLIFAFGRIDRRQPSPLLNSKILNQAGIAGGLIAGGLVSAVIMSTIVVGPFYLSQALHLNAIQAGLVLSIGPIVVALTGLPAGCLADRIGAQTVNRIGLFQLAFGCVVMATIPFLESIAAYLVALIIITSGYAFFQTSNNTMVMSAVPNEDRGIVSGGLNLARNLGLITGTSVMGAIYSAILHLGLPTDIAGASGQGLRATFIAATFLILLSLAVAHRTQKRTKKPASIFFSPSK